jgi:hypothetical protein
MSAVGWRGQEAKEGSFWELHSARAVCDQWLDRQTARREETVLFEAHSGTCDYVLRETHAYVIRVVFIRQSVSAFVRVCL